MADRENRRPTTLGRVPVAPETAEPSALERAKPSAHGTAEPSALEQRTRPAPSALEPDQGTILAILNGVTRKDEWEPPEHLRVLSVMGGVQLDFRRAYLVDGVTEVSVVTLMGGVEIIVPPALNVDMDGTGVMGAFTHATRRPSGEDAPLLRIRGLSLMGGVQLKVKA